MSALIDRLRMEYMEQRMSLPGLRKEAADHIEKLEEALGVLVACASSEDAFGIEDAIANANALLQGA